MFPLQLIVQFVEQEKADIIHRLLALAEGAIQLVEQSENVDEKKRQEDKDDDGVGSGFDLCEKEQGQHQENDRFHENEGGGEEINTLNVVEPQ